MKLRAGLVALFSVLTIALAVPSMGFAQTEAGPSYDHRFNIRTSPLGLLVGWVNVDFDVAITDTLAIGPTVTIWNLSTTIDENTSQEVGLDVKSMKYGGRAMWYPEGVFQTGWYLSPMVQGYKIDVTGKNATGSRTATANDSGVVFTALGGYHWFWDNFNMNLGIGYNFASAGKTKVKVSDGTEEEINTGGGGLAVDFMIGIAF